MKLTSGLVVFIASAGGIASAQPTYHVTDLGTLGGTSSYVGGMNNSCQVVGWSNTAGGSVHAFLYSNGVMTDLGTLGGSTSGANAINDAGLIVGDAYLPGDVAYHAYLRSGGIMKDLGTLGGTNSVALGVNSAGQVVGQSWLPGTEVQSNGLAFLYSGGVMTSLGTLPGGSGSKAWHIDDLGRAFGPSYTASGAYHASSFFGGAVTDLGTLGGVTSDVYSSDNSGRSVGASYLPDGDYHACVYAGGTITDLGTVWGTCSIAWGINSSGQIVGEGNEGDCCCWDGFLYAGGVMTDLNDLLDEDSWAYWIEVGTAIADNGTIAATGYAPDGNEHALLLTPYASVSGKVTLQDFVGDPTQQSVCFELLSPGTTTVLETDWVYLNADETYQFSTGLVGKFDVEAQGQTWLSKRISNVTLGVGGVVTGLSFSLVNGDVNGDDVIDLADLVEIAAAWRSTPDSDNWDPCADLNGDGVVNLADWMIVAKNWRKSGDP